MNADFSSCTRQLRLIAGGRFSWPCLLWAFGLSVAVCLGMTASESVGGLASSPPLGALSLPFYFGCFYGLTIACRGFYAALKRRVDTGGGGVSRAKSFKTFFLILFLIWLSTLVLFYWPGCLSLDSSSSIRQAFGEMPLSNKHPIFFTAIVGVCVSLGTACGSLDAGVALFSIFQIVCLAASCAYCLHWIGETLSTKAADLGLLFFGLNPLISQYAVTMWKDVLFAAAVLFYITVLAKCVRRIKKDSISRLLMAKLIVAGLLVCLLRSNGFLCIFLTALFAMLAFRKGARKLLAGSVISLLVFILAVGPLYGWLGASPAPFRESVGLPLQQLALVDIEGGPISAESRSYLDRLFDRNYLVDNFNPHRVDAVKTFTDSQNSFLEEDKGKLLSVWLDSFAGNESIYFRAWRDLTIGYWYPGTSGWMVVPPGWSLGDYDGLPAKYELKQQGLLVATSFGKVIESGDLIEMLKTFPSPLYPFYNIACMAWYMLLVIALKTSNREKRDLVPLAPLFAIWLCMLVAAPTFCEFRYVFALHLSLPIISSILFFNLEPKYA